MSTPRPLPPPPLIGALLRVPAQAVQRRLIAGLVAAGFHELRLPHIAVFQYPGPEGERPGTIAERAGVSKQAMSHLLQTLEDAGYIRRADAAVDGRTRVVRLTRRGRAATRTILAILRDIEHEWSIELGAKRFTELKGLLTRLWDTALVR